MLNELLSLARLEAGLDQRAVAAFDAGALLSDVCARVQPLAALRGLFLRTDGPASFIVQGDQEKVGRIAGNLVSNALRYTLQGGVTVRWVASDDGDARRWVLSVADTGTRGHSTAAAPVIDELNQIADGKSGHEGGATAAGAPQNDAPPDPDGHGEGIGLSIVKHVCDLLDATLEFSANAEGGSTFRIVFPCHYEQQ
jgi:signal transduction histidine kinase